MPVNLPDKADSVPEKADGTLANVVAEVLMLAGVIWSVVFGFHAEYRHSLDQAYRVAAGRMTDHVVRASVASIRRPEAALSLSANAARTIDRALQHPRSKVRLSGLCPEAEEILWITFSNGLTIHLPVRFSGRRLWLMAYGRSALIRADLRYPKYGYHVPIGPLAKAQMAIVQKVAYKHGYR